MNGWTRSADWKVNGGILISDGTFQETGTIVSPTITPPFQVNETSDYAVEVKIQQLGGKGCFDAVVIRGHITSGGVQGYRLAIGCFGEAAIYTVFMNKIASENFDLDQNWHIYRLEAKGSTISAFIDGMQILSMNDYIHLSGGFTGIKSEQTQVNISSFKIIAL